jgi:hypothetical protein
VALFEILPSSFAIGKHLEPQQTTAACSYGGLGLVGVTLGNARVGRLSFGFLTGRRSIPHGLLFSELACERDEWLRIFRGSFFPMAFRRSLPASGRARDRTIADKRTNSDTFYSQARAPIAGECDFWTFKNDTDKAFAGHCIGSVIIGDCRSSRTDCSQFCTLQADC